VFGAFELATAAGSGQTGMCQHLRSIGCDWDHTACTKAAAAAQVNALHWLRDNGCPWNLNKVVNGTVGTFSNFDILEYVVQQGEVLDAEL
jgi:hypothetical protein